jgi:hypothetical protein
MVGEKMTLQDVVRNVFVAICKRCEISCLMRLDPCPFGPYPIIFMLLNWHWIISWWCLHIIKRCHYQPHLNSFSFVGCYFSWGCYKNLSSCKGRYLLWLVFSGHVFPSSCIKKVFKCLHHTRWTSFFIDVPTWHESEKHWKPFFFSFTRIL